jgi:hypothetical protein
VDVFVLGLLLLLLLSAGFHHAVLLPSVRVQMLCEVLQHLLGRKARLGGKDVTVAL